MKITFVMPCYPWVPMGGFKVVYEYSNQLAKRGHEVTVVHAKQVKFGPQPRLSIYQRIKGARAEYLSRGVTPPIKWQAIDPKVRLLFVSDTSERHIPEGDAIFATAWNTVASVLHYSHAKGTKFYLIQHYETWLGSKELVDDTWRSPMNKVVVSKWLLKIGQGLGAKGLHYIPNALDHDRYALMAPVAKRERQVAMMFSHVPFKGAADGLEALYMAKQKFPDLRAVLFGTGRGPKRLPQWMTFYRDPAQDFLVREIYNNSMIFLSSSWAEGFALPPAEAACCGCAIVATDSGGIRDFIDHEKTGLLSPPRNAQALGENLCRLLGDQELRLGLGDAALRRLQSFRWDESAKMLASFIELSRSVELRNTAAPWPAEALISH